MKFIIHYSGRYEDSLVIEADTIEEIREIDHAETNARNWEKENCWSERA